MTFLLFWAFFQAQENTEIHLLTYPIDVRLGEPSIDPALREETSAFRPFQIFLVHSRAHFSQTLKAELAGQGVKFLGYIPDQAWLVQVPRGLQISRPEIDYFQPYHPAYKIHPALLGAGPLPLLSIRLHADQDPGPVNNFLSQTGALVQSWIDLLGIQRVEVVGATSEWVQAVARLPEVAWIAPVPRREDRNDRSRWIIQSYDDPNNVTMDTPVYDAGIHGEGEIVGVIDGRMDINHCLFLDANPIGPTHRKVVALDSMGSANSHGTHVAGSVAGKNQNGQLSGAGMAYEAKLAFHTGLNNQSGQLLSVLVNHDMVGARIHSNSWGEVDGSPVATAYTQDCEDIDTFMYNNEDNLVLFACMNDSSFPLGPLLSPENALNVLAVGATEAGSSNPASFANRHGSCRSGPTILDGRRKPEVFAPGCSTSSAQANSACGMTSLCGTSMATPVTAGAAALVRQYFREGYYPTGLAVPGDSLIPSGALLKATLMVGTVNMLEDTPNGGGFLDTPIPNNVEGWGRINLDRSLYFAGDNAHLWVQDHRNAEGLAQSETETFQIQVSSGSEPLRVCMVFTAPPATAGTSSPVSNDLDLIVTEPDGTTFYLGNVFASGHSMTGGGPDPINNVEQVWVDNPTPGQWTIEVVGTDVNVGLQGFALAATGDLVASAQLAIETSGAITCWGESMELTGTPVGCSPDVVSWMPTAGLSNPNSLTTMATPTETTTYTLTISDTGGSCMLTSQYTVVVPAMDVNEDMVLDFADLESLYPVFGQTEGQVNWPLVEAYDYDQDLRISILDMLQIWTCIGL
ncbi:MAG: S8 family serine peptidase [Acidobacteria bacterium]|nr:S8 family serine peptidase [Acidobacteriota bacterium]MCB9399436.1 S8 family serine peptidase [Acidobacteriota bacterium]